MISFRCDLFWEFRQHHWTSDSVFSYLAVFASSSGMFCVRSNRGLWASGNPRLVPKRRATLFPSPHSKSQDSNGRQSPLPGRWRSLSDQDHGPTVEGRGGPDTTSPLPPPSQGLVQSRVVLQEKSCQMDSLQCPPWKTTSLGPGGFLSP